MASISVRASRARYLMLTRSILSRQIDMAQGKRNSNHAQQPCSSQGFVRLELERVAASSHKAVWATNAAPNGR